MALSLQYIGVRPYVEVNLSSGGKKHTFGFARDMIRDDIPQDYIKNRIAPMIANGGSAWRIIDSETQADGMVDVLNEKEESNVVEKVVESAVDVTTKMKEAIKKPLSTKAGKVNPMEDRGFSTTMTRAQMMSWCSANGIAVNNRSTKASMTDQARAYATGGSE